jgi:uracil-DNA glycosylase family 4
MSQPLFDLNAICTLPSKHVLIQTEFPSVPSDIRIAVIGDAPEEGDVKECRPFVGTSGNILRSLLTGAGISPMQCMFAYVSRVPRKYSNKKKFKDASVFPWNDPEIIDSIEQLKTDIDVYQPNLILLLGDVPMWVSGKRGESVNNWHGSLFRCETIGSPFRNYKCMATYDTAVALRMYDWMPLLRFDLQRAAEESITSELNLPERRYELHLSSYQIIDRLINLPPGRPIALDIEGYVSWISCLSIATSPHDAFIIPFGTFSPAEDARVIEQLRITMARVDLPKILQNCCYDYFVLAYRYHIHLANIIMDTMLSGWELYPELPKGLGTQTAIWTREPYYKFQRKIDNPVVHWKYCCTDSCVTYEIAEKHLAVLSGDSLEHFKFNMALLPAINYMQLRGMAFDKARANELLERTSTVQAELQLRINKACGKSVNVNSPVALCKILYKDMNFPKQHPKEAGRYDRTKLTSNIDALLEINRIHDSSFIRDLIAWRKCEKLIQILSMPLSPKDQRVRCSYNLVGTDTGRLNCSSSNEVSEVLDKKGEEKDVGTNLTTITKKLRHLFLADEGYDYFQLDLAGADGWTVAAHCARFGDRTMLDDYLHGIKPARVIAYLYLHGVDALKLSRDELYQKSKYIGNDHSPLNTPDVAALYFICKRVQHGTNYLLGPSTMADQILKDSFKLMGQPIYADNKTCVSLQSLYRLRYKGVKAWQTWIEQELRTKGRLGCASGHTRTFFGRRASHETLRSMVAHEPQANTTYATNRALYNLWYDPENRNPDGSLIIEPLHHVHDAMCGQWPMAVRDWAIRKVKSYFADQIVISGQLINIPFEGAYGPSWGETNTPI